MSPMDVIKLDSFTPPAREFLLREANVREVLTRTDALYLLANLREYKDERFPGVIQHLESLLSS
jgi:hypothetical protein